MEQKHKSKNLDKRMEFGEFDIGPEDFPKIELGPKDFPKIGNYELVKFEPPELNKYESPIILNRQ